MEHSLSVNTLSLTTEDKNINNDTIEFRWVPLVIVMSVHRVALHMSYDDTQFFRANYLKDLDVMCMDV